MSKARQSKTMARHESAAVSCMLMEGKEIHEIDGTLLFREIVMIATHYQVKLMLYLVPTMFIRCVFPYLAFLYDGERDFVMNKFEISFQVMTALLTF